MFPRLHFTSVTTYKLGHVVLILVNCNFPFVIFSACVNLLVEN